MKTEAELKKENKKLHVHVKELAKKKYDVELIEDEITTCYHLKSGGIVVYFRIQTQDSGYQKLVEIIKSNKSIKEVNVYFNFMLTRKRNSLLYDVRQLRKDGCITKYFTDENGNISFLAPEMERWKRVTNMFDEDIGGMVNYNIEEIKFMIP